MQLEALGTTISRRSAPSATRDDVEERVVTDSPDVLTQEIAVLYEYIHKNEGALTFRIRGPQSFSPKVMAHVNWDGKQQHAFGDDCETAFIELLHPSIGNTTSCK